MKMNYLFILFIIILLISTIGIFLIMENFELKDELHDFKVNNQVIAITDDETVLEKKIIKKETNPRYKIKVYYPYTSYNKLNKEIEKKINNEIDELIKVAMENTIRPNQYYTLDIIYEHYSYNNYVSYVFYINTYTGGAHPNNVIWTISYDISNDTIITIDTLVEENPNLLIKLSNESKTILKEDKRFNDNDKIINSMLIEGTEPTINNFKRLAFSDERLLIFFEQYQIAPYSYGTFEISIPYSKLFTNN